MKEVLETAFQTAELATKSDVNNAIVLVRKDMEAMEQRLGARIDGREQGLNARIDGTEQRPRARIDANNAKIDALASKLIIQIAGLIMAGIGATAAIVALLPKLFA